MPSRFLFNDDLWNDLNTRVPEAKTVRAAVAYLGSGASKLLPLRGGDRLLVDMSLRSVRAGSTDPNEVAKYLKRGVQVFSRGSLHTKFFVIDSVVIAGSSNISRNAKESLDEAALLTDDASAVRRATGVFDQLCTEPVRAEYLKKCILEYRPPQFMSQAIRGATKRRKVRHAKAWLVAGLRYGGVPEHEREAALRITEGARKKLSDYERCEIDDVNYPGFLKFFKELREGDWIVQCIRDGAGFDVCPPARFLGIESYARSGGRRRYLLLLESPIDARIVRWTEVRARARADVHAINFLRPRTTAIKDDDEADAFLRLWTPLGRFRKTKK